MRPPRFDHMCLYKQIHSNWVLLPFEPVVCPRVGPISVRAVPQGTLDQLLGNQLRHVVVPPTRLLAPEGHRLVEAVRVVPSLVPHVVQVEGRIAGVGGGPRPAKVDESPAYVVVGVDITDQDAGPVERLQVRPHLRDVLGREGAGTLGDLLDDGADREAPVLLVPPPDVPALECGPGVCRRCTPAPENQCGDLEFLCGREEQVAVGRDGEVIPVLLLEPAVGAALTVKRVDVLRIKVRGGELPSEVACPVAFQVDGPVE